MDRETGATGTLILLKPLVTQFAKFGVVGIVATLLHVAVYALLIESAEFPAQAANVTGFVAAVLVSFAGHTRWTFDKSGSGVFIKFFITAVTGIGLNSAAVHIIIEWLTAPYFYAIPFMIFITPPATFMISKFWAFKY